MARKLLWLFLCVEALRLVMWIGFLLWLASAYDAQTWVGPEAAIPSWLAALWLGFPYGWFASCVASNAGFLPEAGHAPVRIALTNFVLWLVATAIIACVWYRLSGRQKVRDSK